VWYLTPPNQFLLTHFPTDDKWQLIDPPIQKKYLDKLVHCEIDPRLLQFGIRLEAILKVLNEKAFPTFVYVENEPKCEFIIRDAPLSKTLRQGQKLSFQFESKNIASMGVFNKGKWVEIPKNGRVFQTEIVPAEGILAVGITRTSAEKSYDRILKYLVEYWPGTVHATLSTRSTKARCSAEAPRCPTGKTRTRPAR